MPAVKRRRQEEEENGSEEVWLIASSDEEDDNGAQSSDEDYVDEEEDEDTISVASSSAKRPAAPQSRSARRPPSDEEDEDDFLQLMGAAHQATPPPLSTLPWGEKNASRREIIERFQQQLQYELHHDANLKQACAPFMHSRAVRKLLADAPRSPLIGKAPRITQQTGALDGYMLRPYQVEGVQFLLDHFHSGVAAILADDMGLGKTPQIASFLSVLHQLHGIKGPHLIIVPLSTITTWARELSRWAPALHCVKYHGSEKSRQAIQLDSHTHRDSVFITTSTTFVADRHYLRKKPWVVAAVDEAHILRGDQTNIGANAGRIDACCRIAVTGTPVHNRPGELWNLMSFLFPMFDTKTTESEHASAAADCARLLKRIMLRRTKQSMDLGIPPRTDLPTVMIDATPLQQEIFRYMRVEVLKENSKEVMALLWRQRHICNHPLTLPLLLDGERRVPVVVEAGESAALARLKRAGIRLHEDDLIAPSGKMRRLDYLLHSLRAEHHRTIIFSNFTSTLDLIEGLCVLRGLGYERLDGDCSRVERELSILRFNHPRATSQVFLVTTSAGGVGLTLTGADTVILFDAHYNPQIDRQAADRAHRIGQTRPVTVYRFCLQNSIEERIQFLSQQKAAMGDFIVDGGDGGNNGGNSTSWLTAEDVREMFAEMGESLTPVALSGASAEQYAKIVDIVSQAKRDEGHIKQRERHGPTRVSIPHTHVCFDCNERMRPMEPLLHCQSCPKAFHRDCIDKESRQGIRPQMWQCPRHECVECGKLQAEDGAMFMCQGCPVSYCFDCLDDRYFALDDKGMQFLNLSHRYPGMEEEGMPLRKSAYYITCLHCSGLLSSDSESDEDVDVMSAVTAPIATAAKASEASQHAKQNVVEDDDTAITVSD